MSNVTWASGVFEKILKKYTPQSQAAARQGIIPYEGDTGKWKGPPHGGVSWWTNGFWPAMMWQLYNATGEDQFKMEARRVQELLRAPLLGHHTLSHDVGFMYLLSFGADHRLTGSEDGKSTTLIAADVLMSRFNPNGFIRAWNGEGREGWAIVDCMMNLPLLHWATEKTGDPRYNLVAGIHADTTIRCFIRPDGSCNHIIIFDPQTGVVLDSPGGQGYACGSSWTRGQAWALHGFVLAHQNTGVEVYLEAAKRVAHYFISNIRPDGLIDCDFRQPKGEERLDNIAGACAASALLLMADMVPELEAPMYRDPAIRMLKAMDELCADWTDEKFGILTKCTAAYHADGNGRHVNIIYGDYFFTEAILRVMGKDANLWGI